MFKNLWVRRIAEAIFILAIGFVLLNLTFMFFAAVAWGIALGFGGMELVRHWIGPVSFGASTLLIGLFTWLILRAKWSVLIKAVWLVVPTAVVLVLLGIGFYRWPWISYISGGILTGITLYLFYRFRSPWLYWFAVLATSLTLLIFTAMGGEI